MAYYSFLEFVLKMAFYAISFSFLWMFGDISGSTIGGFAIVVLNYF